MGNRTQETAVPRQSSGDAKEDERAGANGKKRETPRVLAAAR
jgi:hypothetical protein